MTKILFFTYDVPYPLNSGGKIRAYYLIKNLAKKYQITLFSFYRNEEQKQYVREMKKYCCQVFLFKRRPVWSWQNFLKCLNPGLPFAAATYFSSALKLSLEKELKSGEYKMVHFESFYPALYLPLVKKMGIKTIMGNENVEYQVYNRYASQKPLILRQILWLEVFRVRLFEENLWRLADANIALSANDALAVEKITQKTCPIIPNGVETNLYRKTKNNTDGKTIIFIGTLIYQANNNAVSYFLRDIYPKIKKNFPKVKFLLVSWHKPSWLDQYLRDSTIKFVQDKDTSASELYQKGDIMVAPIRVGSGTRIKILEAMVVGLPVVTTSVGIEGIEAKDGQEVIIADKPQDFADRVVELLNNPQQRQQLGLAGRKLVAEKYDWEKIGEKLNKVYEKIA